MNIAQTLKLLALIKDTWGLSNIDFMPDSYEGDDEDKLCVTIPQVGTIYLYSKTIYLCKTFYPVKLITYNTDLECLFQQIKDYFS